MEDPQLQIEDGTLPPGRPSCLSPLDELYKHLGIERGVDTRRGSMTAKVRSKVARAISRVRKMKT